MTTPSLEDRVTRLEAFVLSLSGSGNRGKKKDWRRTLGMFTGDEIMKRIDEQALKYRRQDRKKVRRPRPSARPAKS
jgi:hypothetical protein